MRTVVTSKKLVWITLAAVLIVNILLLSVQTNKRFNTGFVRVWILDSVAPWEKLVDLTLNGVGRTWRGYFALVDLHGQNQELHSQIDALKRQLAQQEEEVREAARLRKLLDWQNPGLGKTVVARVIGRTSQLHQTVTIDKGQVHGVQQDASVITPDGVVGRVIYAAKRFSIVQLVTDSQSAVAGMVQSSRQQAILRGTGGRDMELDYIDDDNGIKDGDQLITSGMDRVHPKGLALGLVTSVGPRKGLFKTVKIRPAADLSRLEEVLCIAERPPGVTESLEESSATANLN